MKKLFRSLFLAATLFFSVALMSYGQEAVMLPESGISCSQHTVDVTIGGGFLSLTYHLLITDCDNGESYVDFMR